MQRWAFGGMCFLGGLLAAWTLIPEKPRPRFYDRATSGQDVRPAGAEPKGGLDPGPPVPKTNETPASAGPPQRIDLAHVDFAPLADDVRKAGERTARTPGSMDGPVQHKDKAAPSSEGAPDAPAEEGEAPVVAQAGPATIRGYVWIDGDPLAPNHAADMLDVGRDPRCKSVFKKAPPDDAAINGGTRRLAHAMVWIDNPPAREAGLGRKTVRIAYKGCALAPPVAAIEAGDLIEFSNEDPLLHGLTISVGGKVLSNLPLPKQGQTIRKALRPLYAKSKFLSLSCFAHPWETATLYIREHPYFDITAADGTFTIPSLPDGTYRVAAEHPALGRLTETSTVVIQNGYASAYAVLHTKNAKTR